MILSVITMLLGSIGETQKILLTYLGINLDIFIWLSAVRQNCGLVDLDPSNSLGNKSHGSKGMALGIEPAVQEEGQLKCSLTSDQVLIDICFNYIYGKKKST